MASGALQIVGHGPVILVTQLVFHHGREIGREPAQLAVAKGVFQPGFGEKTAVLVLGSLRGHDHAVAALFYRAFHPGQEFLPVEGDFREQDYMGRIPLFLCGQSRRRGNPARVAAHDFQDEHPGGGFAHGGDVHGGLAGGNSDIFRHRPEAGAVVGQRQVVIDGLGHMDGLQRVAHRRTQLRDFEAGIGGVAAAVVKEIADIMGPEYLDQPLVFGPVLFQAFQFVAAGAEGAGGRGQQPANRGAALLAGVDQVFSQRTYDAVAPGVDLADPVLVFPGGFDDAAGGGIDDGGDATGLGVKGVFLRHRRWFLGHRPHPWPAGWPWI